MDQQRINFLKQLKKYGIQENIPNISWETAEFIHSQVQNKNPKNVLEIGTANGFSTIWIADALSSGKIVTIERSAPTFRESIQNFSDAGVEKSITSIYGDAKLILKNWNIDGSLKQIDSLDEVPKGPQYIEGDGLVYASDTTATHSKSFDLVFIDAQKVSYINFWNLVQPLLTDNPLIIVDDVLKFSDKTESFTQLMESQTDWSYKIHKTDSDDGVMVCWKK